MCVTESWLNSSLPDSKVYIEDYNLFRLDRVIDKVGGGLICYIKNTLYEFCKIETTLSLSNKHVELQVINITQPKHRLLSIVQVYRPPNGICTLALRLLWIPAKVRFWMDGKYG